MKIKNKIKNLQKKATILKLYKFKKFEFLSITMIKLQ